MEYRRIDEMIVVEGKNDTNRLKRFFKCDTIETNGSAISGSTLEKIKLALDRRGVIVFTDPDYPGEKVRKTINEYVPGCKHAFLPREAAIDHRRNKIGIEHANEHELYQALLYAKTSFEKVPNGAEHDGISREDLHTAGLIAGPEAKQKRELLGKELKIGYTNGKQLCNRLTQFHISSDEFSQALRLVERKLDYDKHE
ncbi:ribonuclease M5 [Salipaludibacillus neizhouensis]|uniref:Ribonuclease M5 n=1 Tax=Salipaludibacillus neizhouensis TaxID=885475 RepID=A0A3A9K4G5_9BACI|nr:ribonuclease M5 [Salipaludibacillus neizhouensis]RKL65201.1 ribonuclease M5 [Salipaludibacillus neizhouensis]